MQDMQHAQAAELQVGLWRRARPAPAGTHHTVDGKPLYAARFELVRDFAEPGIAPAQDRSGAFHINSAGEPMYANRFVEAWGFYGGLAAVEEPRRGWLHILTNGVPLYRDRFKWCGNFQESRCPVRDDAGFYHHIDAQGCKVYADSYLYAGDYREQAAVVRFADDGRCGHIDVSGRPLHARRFEDLDVFHKGLARARDCKGWFHISRDGRDAYFARFSNIEPFYNGTALAETFNGDRVLVTPTGTIARVIAESSLVKSTASAT